MIAKLRGPLAWTLAVEGAGVVAGLLTLRLAAAHFSVEGFGAYTVARRLVSVAAFPLLLGFGIALPRAVAHALAEPSGKSAPGAYGLAAGGLAALSLALFSMVALLVPGPLAELTFGTRAAGHLVPPLVLATVGIALHTLSYAWYRGRASWTTANAIQVAAIALVPPLAVTFSGSDTARALALTGAGWCLTGGIGVALAWAKQELTPATGLKPAARELLHFGVPRIPGELALFGLLALPSVMVAHREGLAAAGYVSFALSLVQLSAAALAPVGTLLLPVVSREAALGNWATLRKVVAQFLAVGVGVAAALALGVIVGAPLVVKILLGPDYVAAVPTARWLAPAAVPYAIYLILRNPLDAIATHPHNTRNLLVALAALWLLLGPLGYSPAASVIGAYTLLGGLSAWDWLRLSRTAG